MTKAITFCGLATIMAALRTVASAQCPDVETRGADTIAEVAVWHSDATGNDVVCSGTAYCWNGHESCEVIMDVACTMTLSQCLRASFYAGASDEHDDVLGCTPDAPITIAVIDQSALLAMLPSCEPGDDMRSCN